MVFRIRAIIWYLYHSKLVFIPWLTSVFTIVNHGALLPHYTMVLCVLKHHGIHGIVWYPYHSKLWFLYHA